MAFQVPHLGPHLAAAGILDAEDPAVAVLEAVLDRVAAHGPLARLAAPLPECEPFPEGRLSPRLLALLARSLDAPAGGRILLVGDPLVTLAAYLTALHPELAEVRVVTQNPSHARWTARRLHIDDREPSVILTKRDAAPERGPWDRILLLDVADATERHAHRAALAPTGHLLDVACHTRPTRFRQVMPTGDEHATMELTRHHLGPRESKPHPRTPTRTPEGATVGRILNVERMQDQAWRGIATSPTAQGVLRAVRETFLRDDPDDAHGDDARLARRVFHLAYLEQVAGTRSTAEALYRASIALHESAEAWTFFGWIRSQSGRLHEAIDACHRAIRLDPALGNPYNDIGAYLMAEGQNEEARRWFERATEAPRYAAPHYPYTNLGRLHLRQGDLGAAREAVEYALEMMPGYPPAERLLREIESRETHDPTQR